MQWCCQEQSINLDCQFCSTNGLLLPKNGLHFVFQAHWAQCFRLNSIWSIINFANYWAWHMEALRRTKCSSSLGPKWKVGKAQYVPLWALLNLWSCLKIETLNSSTCQCTYSLLQLKSTDYDVPSQQQRKEGREHRAIRYPSGMGRKPLIVCAFAKQVSQLLPKLPFSVYKRKAFEVAAVLVKRQRNKQLARIQCWWANAIVWVQVLQKVG